MDDPSLAATRKDTSAEPCPDAGVNAEIQLTFVDASHAHSGCVKMLREPVAPTASIIGGAPSDTTHLTGLGLVLTVEDVSHPDTSSATSSPTPAVNNPRHPTRTSAKHSTAGLGIGDFDASKTHSSASVASPWRSPENSSSGNGSTSHKLDACSLFNASSAVAGCRKPLIGRRSWLQTVERSLSHRKAITVAKKLYDPSSLSRSSRGCRTASKHTPVSFGS